MESDPSAESFLAEFKLRLPRSSKDQSYSPKEAVALQLQNREYGILYFRGQTVFHIRKDAFARLGIDGLTECVKQVYGARLFDFGTFGNMAEDAVSFSFELPPDTGYLDVEAKKILDDADRDKFTTEAWALICKSEPVFLVKELVELIQQRLAGIV